ncbi:hypothetical protein DFJ73DRAFT_842060 [Zopfochytrium polystomum]|nr:hypothetical protein DFJ73DRAFT_842060 [Zopfochytrium polystomum]
MHTPSTATSSFPRQQPPRRLHSAVALIFSSALAVLVCLSAACLPSAVAAPATFKWENSALTPSSAQIYVGDSVTVQFNFAVGNVVLNQESALGVCKPIDQNNATIPTTNVNSASSVTSKTFKFQRVGTYFFYIDDIINNSCQQGAEATVTVLTAPSTSASPSQTGSAGSSSGASGTASSGRGGAATSSASGGSGDGGVISAPPAGTTITPSGSNGPSVSKVTLSGEIPGRPRAGQTAVLRFGATGAVLVALLPALGWGLAVF